LAPYITSVPQIKLLFSPCYAEGTILGITGETNLFTARSREMVLLNKASRTKKTKIAIVVEEYS
jgi:hypothetical protein